MKRNIFKLQFKYILRKMGTISEDTLIGRVRAIVPPLTNDRHKGEAGRIGIIGGSVDYTGAAYYSAITTLRIGGDLAHVFCCKDAALPIKSYSPELIVHPILDTQNSISLIEPWLPRLHVLVIGPGLGRDQNVLKNVENIIKLCSENASKPLVIDADGLFLLTEKPHIIKDYPHGAILTPNAMEFSRLAKSVLGEDWKATPNPDPARVKHLARSLGKNIVVVHKGAQDVIASGNGEVIFCSASGSPRRCGGQGDVLSGSLGIFYAWSLHGKDTPGIIASYGGCRLTRECSARAFTKHARSTLTTDLICEIHDVFQDLFENDSAQ